MKIKSYRRIGFWEKVKMVEPKTHWETVYKTKSPTEVSWHKAHLEKSLQLISKTGVDREGQIIDVGGGPSTLVDDLLMNGFKHITVLDVSPEALRVSQARLGDRAKEVTWIEADITQATLPENAYDVWHDRAVFHFLTLPEDRLNYVKALKHSLKPGGHLIVSAFGVNGPKRCSGLDIVRYSPETIHAEFGDVFQLLESFKETHQTPSGNQQEFVYSHFLRSS